MLSEDGIGSSSVRKQGESGCPAEYAAGKGFHDFIYLLLAITRPQCHQEFINGKAIAAVDEYSLVG